MSGVMCLANCLNKEPISCKVRVIISDKDFVINNYVHENQIKKNLIFNIAKDNEWGTYVFLPLENENKRVVTNATEFCNDSF